MTTKKINDTNVCIWYSGATDITGKKLAEELGINHGNNKPTGATVVIGWGTKLKDKISTGNVSYLNDPNAILANRNKFNALNLMGKGKVAVAPFVTAKEIAKIGKGQSVCLPVIGRTSYHQGGKGFWLCPTMSHVRNAIEEGAGYFQELIEIKEEYRLHVFCGKVIYAVKKVRMSKEEMENSYVKHELERQESLANKSGEKFDIQAAKSVINRQAKKASAGGPDMIVRSNRRGWKFSKVSKWKNALEKEAVKALDAIGLDFGAVDCCIDTNDNSWVIEVNTGPGLEGSAFTAWVEALKEKLKEMLHSDSSSSSSSEKKNSKNKKSVAQPLAKSAISKAMNTKEKLVERLDFMKTLIDTAEDEEEAAVLDKMFSRVFSK